jgi:hypothetical protein
VRVQVIRDEKQPPAATNSHRQMHRCIGDTRSWPYSFLPTILATTDLQRIVSIFLRNKALLPSLDRTIKRVTFRPDDADDMLAGSGGGRGHSVTAMAQRSSGCDSECERCVSARTAWRILSWTRTRTAVENGMNSGMIGWCCQGRSI